MFDDFAPKLAAILTGYSIPIREGDQVIIIGSPEAAPLIREVYAAVLHRGGHPMTYIELPGLQECLLREASEAQLAFVDPIQLTTVQQIDVMYYIDAASNTAALTPIDPARMAIYQQSQRPFMETYLKRAAEGTLRWNLTLWPTHAAAQDAEMGLLAYTEFVYKACALDHADPLVYWQALRDRQARLIDWLEGKQHAEVRGPGIELSFRFDGRRWLNSWGNQNFPSGEIYTSPLEDSATGQIAFNYPTVLGGREVSGVRLTLKDGVVVEAGADKGEDYLLSQLDLDAGARRLGEVGIGTNTGIQQFTGHTLFDEKMGGTMHVALGHGFEEAGGTNKSAIHWDMVHNMRDGGEILIDGEPFYQNGAFVVE